MALFVCFLLVSLNRPDTFTVLLKGPHPPSIPFLGSEAMLQSFTLRAKSLTARKQNMHVSKTGPEAVRRH